MRRVATSMIKPHMTLAQPIYSDDRLLLKIGCTDLTKYIKSLESIGISYVYIEDELSQGIEIPDAISIETRNKCKESLRNIMNTFTATGIIDIYQMSDSIDQLLDEILANENILVSLNAISSTDDETFVHSVSTTVYSLIIGKQLGYKRKMLNKLAVGTLLHDLGKTIVDRKIMFKTGKLTDEEFELVKQHPVLGYNALKKNSHISELSKRIALTHHEKLDGTGYPYGLHANELHEFSKIAAIADIYDALTMDRCYRKKWSAQSASDYIVENSVSKLDANLSALLLQHIAIFPNGTMVKLSNNCIGIIKEQNNSFPLRPIVRLVRDEHGGTISPTYDLDLFNELSLTIVESEIELPLS